MPRGRPTKFDNNELLDKAVDLIWREGPMAMSLNDMAAALDTTKPALSRRFGGKDDFLVAVLTRYHDRLDGPVQKALSEAKSVQGVAQAYLGTFLDVLSRKPVGSATGCLLAATTEACANQPDTPLFDSVQSLNGKTRAALVAALKREGANEPEELAQYIHGQSVAMAFLSRSGVAAADLRDFVNRSLTADLT